MSLFATSATITTNLRPSSVCSTNQHLLLRLSPLLTARHGASAAWRYKKEPQTAESIYDSLFDELTPPPALRGAVVTPREDAEAGLVRRMLAIRRRPWDLQVLAPARLLLVEGEGRPACSRTGISRARAGHPQPPPPPLAQVA
jgi:hypothetical protein